MKNKILLDAKISHISDPEMNPWRIHSKIARHKKVLMRRRRWVWDGGLSVMSHSEQIEYWV